MTPWDNDPLTHNNTPENSDIQYTTLGEHSYLFF